MKNIEEMIEEAFDGPDIELIHPHDEGFIFNQLEKNLEQLDLDKLADEMDANEL